MANICTYIFKRGIKKGKNCKETCYLNHLYCKKHISNKKSRSSNIETIITKMPIIQVYKKIQEDSVKNKIFSLDTCEQNKSIIFKHYNNMKRSDPNSTEYYKK